MKKTVEAFATKDPIFLSPEASINSALQAMQGERLVAAAPVLEGGSVVGLVHIHDLINKEINK